MPEKFDNATLHEEITDYLYENATPTRNTNAGDEIVKAWRNFDDYLKRHPEIWQSLADKLWDGFVDYKDIPFDNKEIWHEQKN